MELYEWKNSKAKDSRSESWGMLTSFVTQKMMRSLLHAPAMRLKIRQQPTILEHEEACLLFMSPAGRREGTPVAQGGTKVRLDPAEARMAHAFARRVMCLSMLG
jgi:hypothetical protein